jgi:hypothetical protein
LPSTVRSLVFVVVLVEPPEDVRIDDEAVVVTVAASFTVNDAAEIVTSVGEVTNIPESLTREMPGSPAEPSGFGKPDWPPPRR